MTPCPFCGASPRVEQSRAGYRVRCSCGYFSPSFPSEEVAWRAWGDYVGALEKARASLLPCPFCGCSVSLDIGVYGGGGGDLFQVVHPENDCILSEVVSWSSTLDEVVPAWNSRVKEGGIVTLPCPDCGAEYPLAEFIHGGVRLTCLRCGYFGPVCPSIQEAGLAWDDAVRKGPAARH